MILKENLKGKRILDIGTGTGLLSIAAALVGADEVVATDMEVIETEVLYNARLNQVEDKIAVIQEDVFSPNFKIEGSFDWILMNITAHEIRDLLSFVDIHLVEKGKVLLSGMVEWNYQETLDLYKEKGYSVLDITKSDEWVTALIKH
jgi:ribosomal protein L11 methyltransferase